MERGKKISEQKKGVHIPRNAIHRVLQLKYNTKKINRMFNEYQKRYQH